MSDINSNDTMNGSFNGKSIIGGTFNGKVIFGGAYTLQGDINDNVTNGVVQQSYSVSGAQGDTGTFNVVLSADDGYKFETNTTVTFGGLGNAITAPASCSLSADTITLTCVMSYTLPNTGYNSENTITDNFTVAANAVIAPVPFSCADWTGYTTSVSGTGLVTITNNGTAAGTEVLHRTCSTNVNGCTPLGPCQATVQVKVPVSAQWSNSNQLITCTVAGLYTPVTKEDFTSQSDWTGSATFDPDGDIVVANEGNLENITSLGTSAYGGCVDRGVTVTVSGTVDDSDFCNDGESVSFSYTTTQSGSGENLSPAVPSPTVSSGGTVSGIVYDSNLVSPSYTTVPSNIIDNTCDDCCTPRVYTFNFTGTIPSTYCNAGTWNASTKVTQPAEGNDLDSQFDWDGSISVSSSGNVTITNGSELSNIVVAALTPCIGEYNEDFGTNTLSCPSVTSECNNELFVRSFSVSGSVEPDNSEFCNAGEETSFTATSTQTGGSTPESISCSDFSISSTGAITSPSYVTTDPVSFSGSKVNIDRTFTYSGTIPNTYCNGGTSVSGTCTITQPGNSSVNTISVSDSTLSFEQDGAESHTVIVTVNGDNTFVAFAPATWITLTIDGEDVTVEVDENDSAGTRQAVITFTHSADSNITTTTTVTQGGNLGLPIE